MKRRVWMAGLVVMVMLLAAMQSAPAEVTEPMLEPLDAVKVAVGMLLEWVRARVMGWFRTRR